MVYSFVKFVNKHFIRGNQDIMAKYGEKDSWAVITGGSDGIGLGYCHLLAKQGFNICIISRTEQKINEKLEEIKKACGKEIKTMAIQADLGKVTSEKDVEHIVQKLKQIDVALLILNAGCVTLGDLNEEYSSEITAMINLDVNHCVYLAHGMIPQLMSR